MNFFGDGKQRNPTTRGHVCEIFGVCDLSCIMLYGGFLKLVVPNNHGFYYYKMIFLGCFRGTTISGNTHIIVGRFWLGGREGSWIHAFWLMMDTHGLYLINNTLVAD